MNEDSMMEHLQDLFWSAASEIESVRTFEDAGVMTRNKGLVVRTQDGAEFQLTIVQSRDAQISEGEKDFF